jgi:hypothetical protein
MNVYFRARICLTYIGTRPGISPLAFIRQFSLSNFTDNRMFCNSRMCHAPHVMIRDLITRNFILCPYSIFIALLLSIDIYIKLENNMHNRKHSDILKFHQLKSRISFESSPSTLRMKIKYLSKSLVHLSSTLVIWI